MIGGTLVVGAVDQPAVFDAQRILEPQQRVRRRHQPAGEEMPAHPVVVAGGLERIQQGAVAEDVHEQLAARPQPPADAPEQGRVVAHVLEHLHRHAAVEVGGRQLQPVHIAGDHPHVGEAALAALRLDEGALRRGVGHRGNPRIRIVLGHPEGQRTPATTQLQDLLAVREFRTFAVQREHRLLGLRQRLVTRRVIATGVLQPRPQAAGKESRWQFVMLAVGGIGMDGDRALAQFRDQRGIAARGGIGIIGMFVAQAGLAHPADAGAQQHVGHQAAFGQAQHAIGRAVAGQFHRIGGGVHRSSITSQAWETTGTTSACCAGSARSPRRACAAPAPR